MDVDLLLGLLGLVVGVVPYAAIAFRWRLSRHPARAFLGLSKDGPIDVIVSTNSSRPAGVGEAKTFTTAVGELRSVAVGARTVLRLYRQKKVSVFMSAEYPGRLQDDTLILGGPLRNNYAQRFLDYVNETYPEAALQFDARAGLVGIGGRSVEFDQQREAGVPREDLALLVLAAVPGSDRPSQRFALCAGLSTYGTEGAARLLFQQVLSPTRHGLRLRRRLSGAVAAAIVHVWIEGRQVIRTELYGDYCWSAAKARRRPQREAAPVRAAR